jgi:enamine deaminase RidA (YjgF/YER057c/UK114 family)
MQFIYFIANIKTYYPMKKLSLSLILTLTVMSAFAQKITNPKELFDPSAYGFSHVVSVSAPNQFIFVAGQGGEEDTNGKLTPDFRTQTRQSLKNIQIALKTQGSTMDDVVKVTTLVVDHDDEKLKIIIEEFEKMWPKKNFPVNTLIPVPRLAISGMLVEIDATALKATK